MVKLDTSSISALNSYCLNKYNERIIKGILGIEKK